MTNAEALQQSCAEHPTAACARCREKLQEEESGCLLNGLGWSLVLLGLLVCLARPLYEIRRPLVPAVAVIVVGAGLIRKRFWWRCPACGSRYVRRRPPRSFPSSASNENQSSEEVGPAPF